MFYNVNYYFVLFFSSNSSISDDSLNFGGFLSFFTSGRGKSSSHNTLFNQSNIFSFLQAKEFSDFVSSLRSQSSWNIGVS